MILLRNLPKLVKLASKPIILSRNTNFLLNQSQFRCLTSKITFTAPEPNAEKIYNGTLTSQIKAVKVFSVTTSLGGLVAQPILAEQGAKIGGMPMVIFLCTFVGFFTFVTPFLLHFITRRYVTEMFYNQDKDLYTATTLSIFLQKKNVRKL